MAAHKCLYLWFSFMAIFWLPSTLTETENYIVHMDLAAMPKPFASHHSWYSATLSSVLDNSRLGTTSSSSSSLSSKLIHSYKYAINGFSASLTPSELEALQKFSGYVSCVHDSSVQADTTYSSHFLGLSSNSGLLPISNYGRDVIIGFVDTGVWPESESFNDDGMSEIPTRWKGECESGTHFSPSLCNKKLIGARFFNKGLIAKFPNLTISMNSTRDTIGHGTHTSTTAAGSYVKEASFFGYGLGTARGVAPQARVAIYKAIWEEGSYVSDIIAAIDQAILDGVDVISLSLGSDGVPLYEDPVAIATFAAMERGIFVTTSAGNKGPNLGTVHNGAPWVLNVAAGTMDRDFGGTIKLGNGVSVLGSSLFPLNSAMALSPLPIVFMGGCHNLKKLKKVGYKIAVCEDKDEHSLSLQVDNVQSAKVAVGVFISNISDWDNLVQTSYPSIFLTPYHGNIIKNYIKSNSSNPKARVSFQKTIFGRKPASSVARYSSRGPSESCPFVLKPDIMAPGDAILASWPQNVVATEVNSRSIYSKFNVLSGTSMSCPHAAGVAALLKGVHPRWSTAAIRSAMMTTADVLDNTQTPIKDLGNKNKLATPLAMGSGHVNPNKAMDPGLIYDMGLQDYINLLCALNYTKNQIQTITRSTSNNCKNPSLDLNYPSFIVNVNASDLKTAREISREFKRTLTNTGQKGTTYEAKLTPMNGLRVAVKPKKLEFKRKDHKLSFKLKIAGRARVKRETDVVFGYLSWVEIGGEHIVRSPIVVTSLTFKVRSHWN